MSQARTDAEQPSAHAEARYTAGYSLGSAIVDVDTDVANAARWLQGFLAPWMAATAFGNGHVLVHFTRSQAAFDDLERRSASATRSIPCFVLDRQLVTLEGYDDGEGGLVLADRELGCFYCIRKGRIDIVGGPEARRAKLGLMRVVREILAARTLAAGRVLDLHAAAFEVARRAVLVAGPKKSGKTTLLCYALASGKARLIANDRVFVEIAGDAPADVCGIPTLVSIRPDMLGSFPMLRNAPGATAAPDDAAPKPMHLSPAQVAERLGSSCVRTAPLAAIVFPEITGDADTWTVDALSTADGLARLGGSFYGGRQRDSIPTIFEEIGGPLPGRAEPAVIARRLAERVRFFRCRLGPRAYERDAGEWFSAIGIDAAGDPTGR